MMTETEFVNKVREMRPAYLKACADYLDAMERLDFKSAVDFGSTTYELLGTDAMLFMMKQIEEMDNLNLEEFSDKYERMTEELAEKYLEEE